MAEVFALAAGVVGVTSLAVQLVDSANKLRGCYDDYKNAQPQVQELTKELELLAKVLKGYPAPQDSSTVLVVDEECRQWCNAIRNELAVVLQELEESFVKRSPKKAALKFVFKKDKTNQWLQRLERAKTMLMLAKQLSDNRESLGIRDKLNAMQQAIDLQRSELTSGIAGLALQGQATESRQSQRFDTIQQSLGQSNDTAMETSREVAAIRQSVSTLKLHEQQTGRNLSMLMTATLATKQSIANMPRQFEATERTIRQHFTEQRQSDREQLMISNQILQVVQSLQLRAEISGDTVETGEIQNTERQMTTLARHMSGGSHDLGPDTEILMKQPFLGYEYVVMRRPISQAHTECTSSTKKRNPRRRNGVLFKIKLPAIFVEYQWVLAVKRASLGWGPTITPYCVRRNGSKIFTLCSSGNLHDVRVMLESKEASVHDVDELGDNLLKYAFARFNVEVITYLVGKGLRLDASLLVQFAHFWLPGQVLIGPTERICLLRSCVDELCDASKPKGRFRDIVRIETKILLEGTPVTHLTNSEKVRYILWLSAYYEAICHEEHKPILEPILDDPEIYKVQFFDRSLSGVAGRDMGHQLASSVLLDMEVVHPLICRILACAIRYGDIPSDPTWTSAAFLQYLQQFTTHEHKAEPDLTRALQLWASLFEQENVDLLQYGAWQLEQLQRLPKDRIGCWCGCWLVTEDCVANECLGFHYGPEPSDWFFWSLEPTDRFAGDFWRQLERRADATLLMSKIIQAHVRLSERYRLAKHDCSQRMPGSWQPPALPADQMREVDHDQMTQMIVELGEKEFQALTEACESGLPDRQLSIRVRSLLDLFLAGCHCLEPPEI